MSEPLRENDAARIGRRLNANWQPTDVERALAATHARIAVRRQRLALGAAGLAVSLAAAVLIAVFYRPGATPKAAPESSARAAAPLVDPVTYFADGSTARVLGGGQIVVQVATDTRIETVLESGAAEYSVAPKPSRAFVVHAGSVTVEVIGTQFLVENEGERVRVAVTRGKVRVTAGDEKAELVPGESRWFAKHEKVASEASEPAPGHPAAGVSQRERFVDLARRGDYGNAYQLLSRSPNAVGSTAEELMLAADAARLSNHPVEALAFLKRVTREHPHDTRAPLSAFTQGRILLSQLGRPAEAADAFEQARRLAPAGSLAGLALARQIEALNRAGNAERARELAAEYARHYPNAKPLAVPEEPRSP